MSDMEKQPLDPACETCPVHQRAYLLKLGVDMEEWDFVQCAYWSQAAHGKLAW